VNHQLLIANHQLQIAEQGQITDRYNAAITNLGSRSIEVRLGGIYALQRLMQDSPRDQPTVIAVLCAFVRDQTSPAVKPKEPPRSQPPTDIQAAVTVVGTRNTANDGSTTVLDFYHAQLANAQLTSLQLSGADFIGATLTGANLTRATPYGANLTRATPYGANLTRANLTGANLTRAWLDSANLTRAGLTGATLNSAYLGDYLPPPAADTVSACFWPCGTTIAYLPRNRVVSGWAITASGCPEAVITGSVPSLTRIPRRCHRRHANHGRARTGTRRSPPGRSR
jgi:Pentapeptide repeats (8 copies)